MDPTPQKHPKTPTSATTPFIPTTAAAASMTRQRRHPDPTALQNFPTHQPSSRLKPTHRARTSLKPSNPQPPPPAPSHRVDTHSQAKRMSVSAIADSSKAFLVKPHRLHATFVSEKHRETSKSDLKEKLKKSSARAPKEKEEKELNVAMDIVKPFASLGVAGGRRRSFGGSKVELGDFLTCNGVKVVSVDMPAFMQIHAVDCARKTRDSLEKFTSKTLAQTLKKEFDEVYGPAWHCIVGTSFGSFVTHSVGGFLYFSMDQKLYVLLFKTTVQRAD